MTSLGVLYSGMRACYIRYVTVGLGLGRQRLQRVARLEIFLETKRGLTLNHKTAAAVAILYGR